MGVAASANVDVASLGHSCSAFYSSGRATKAPLLVAHWTLTVLLESAARIVEAFTSLRAGRFGTRSRMEPTGCRCGRTGAWFSLSMDELHGGRSVK